MWLDDYLEAKPEAVETFPADQDTRVFKVQHKMFALIVEKEGVSRVNLKCEPDYALVLREKFDSVVPGHHMNKKHWNSIFLDGSVPKDEIKRMVDHSYAIVVAGMPTDPRVGLEERHGKEVLYRGLEVDSEASVD
ncbi:MAG: MmcQ/YjbR family DNA-binding protein [Pontibacterium sp.]